MELMFGPGDVVIHLLTSEWLMILAQVTEEEPKGYTVRRSSDYSIMNLAHFEVGVPKEEKNDSNQDNGRSTEGNQEGVRGPETIEDDGS